jgi:hypothetical protein
VLLVWGEQNTESKLGYVAEYCATCQDVRAVKVLRVGRTSHLYHVPLGQGRLLGYDGVCRRCELRFGVEITDYPALEQDKTVDLVALVAKTNPKLLAGNDTVLAAWRRMNEVREPFARCNQLLVQHSAGGPSLDTPTLLALVGSFLAPVALAFAAHKLALRRTDDFHFWLGLWCIVLFFGGLFWTSRLARTAPQRYFRKHLEQPLLDDLRRAAPQRDELLSCLAALGDYGYPVAEAVSTERVLDCATDGEASATRAAKDAAPASAPSPAPRPTLVLSHGGKDYRFTPGVAAIVIGRAKENAIVLTSQYVSRSHVQITWPAGGAPRLKNLSKAGASLRPDGATQAMPCMDEVGLHGGGTIALGKDFAGAESRGDAIRYQVYDA